MSSSATGGSARRLASPRRGDHGFILVSVIWIAGILSAFTISVSVSVRSHALHARNAMSEVLAASVADGLTRLAALQAARDNDPRMTDGGWVSCAWSEEADAWLSLQHQGGLVDLNTASPRLVLALLSGLGLAPEQAASLASALRDHRDDDHVADFGASEPIFYPGRNFGPKNQPFEVVEELDQLPGMSRDLFQRLRNLTTVSSQQTGIDFETAPVELLQVLGLSRTSAAGLTFASPRAARVVALTVAVRLKDATRFVRRALIEVTDQREQPFAVISWDAGEWPRALPPESGAPCLDGKGGLGAVGS